MWFILAFASSLFAALTSILAKIGIEGGKFESCYSHPYRRCAGPFLGHGFSNQFSEWYF